MSNPQRILGKAVAQPTQVRRPWRATARTIFQGVVGAAAMAAPVYGAATHHDPAAATGWAATGLAISAGVTRVMALPGVNDWLGKFIPFLAAAPVHEEPTVPVSEVHTTNDEFYGRG